MGAPERIDKRVLGLTLSSAALIAAFLAAHEFGRNRHLADLPWADKTPHPADLLIGILLLLVLRLGFIITGLFPGYHVVSSRLKATMTGTFVYLGLLSAAMLSLRFFSDEATVIPYRFVFGAWLIALPLVAQQAMAFFRSVYQNLELHLENERELSGRLFRQTTTDPLTGLPNRLLFYDRLARALARGERNSSRVAVLFIDLDRFKQVNESLGLEGGDRILQVMAGKLVECLRGHDTICRIGGDEFLAFATDLGDVNQDLPAMIRRLIEELSSPVTVEGQDVICTASVGVAVYPEDGRDVATLVKHSDHAMGVAKEGGRNNFVLFGPEMQASVSERGLLEAELRVGVKRGELFLEYQPQVDASDRTVVAAEALVRWLHPRRGRLEPGAFVHLAEASSLIIELDRWVLQSACEQLSQWHRNGFSNLRMSVNLSARNFYRGDLVQFVQDTLRLHHLQGSHLDVEITESTLMTKTPGAVDILQGLRGLGVCVSLDDFGTGYSALGYLNRFPVDGLKIDRSLVLDVWSSASAAAITTAVVAIGKSLNLKVVAEGVETEAQLSFLRAQGCNLIQGFLFSRPLEASRFEALLRGPGVPIVLPTTRSNVG